MKKNLLILLLALPCFGQSTNCVPQPSGLVGWWRGENNANDSSGTNNGTILNSVYFEPGMVGQCFHFVSGPNPRILLPDSPELQLTNSLTIEGWIKVNLGYWIFDRGDDTIGEVPYGLGFDNGQGNPGNMSLGFTVRSSPTDLIWLTTPPPFPTNVWVHIAATFDGGSGDMRIYMNGQVIAQTNTTIRPTCPLTGLNKSVAIGNAAGTAGFPLDGWIDEISLYSRALSQAEVQAIYNAGAAGKCLGPSAPSIVRQPQGQVGYWGGSVTFDVETVGAAPLTYLWSKDGLAISWATNSTLTLTNLALDAGGNYSVVVSNAYGSVTSSNALLTVNPAGVSLGLYPGLTIQGTPGNSYGIQYTTNVSASATWLTLTQFTLVQPLQLWVDISNNATGGNTPRRFYRVVALP